ncbi:MAG: T9SS type A sorting domain-containing protein [Flavobacteriales bacterium]
MRALYLLLTALLSIPAQAQLWEHADQRDEEIHLYGAFPLAGDRWAVIGRTTWAGSHLISVRESDGSVAWEDVGPYLIGQGWGEVVMMPDSGLLHVGVNDGCDVLGPDSRVRRYAADGTVLWERFLYPMFTSTPTMAAKGIVDHIAIASSDSVHIMDLNGMSVGGFEVPSNGVRKIHWASDSSLFMLQGTDLRLIDLDGIVLASSPIGPGVRDIHWDGPSVFVLTSDSVRRFDAMLDPVGSSPLPGQNYSSRFIPSDSGLFVNTTTALYELDTNGVPGQLFPWPALPNHGTSACAIRSGDVLSVGNTVISGRTTGIVRKLSMDGVAISHAEDVEVLLQVDSARAEHAGGWFPFWDQRADVTGRVVNHGPDTLFRVVVSMWIDLPVMLCSHMTNRIDTSGFVLAPGDTLDLPFGDVFVARGVSPTAAPIGEVCLVALAPNGLADRAPDDNTACETVDFVLGVQDEDAPPSIALSPNPATDRCFLKGSAGLGTSVQVRVLDLAGRDMPVRSRLLSDNSLEVDVSSFPAGTYVMSVLQNDKQTALKLVVAR